MYELRKLKEALTYWNSDTRLGKTSNGYSYHTPVPQAELQEAEVQPINTD